MAVTPIDCNSNFSCSKLNTMISEINSTANEVNNNATSAATNANNAASSANAANDSKTAAETARDEAQAIKDSISAPEGALVRSVNTATAGQTTYAVTNKSVVIAMTGTGANLEFSRTDNDITLTDYTPNEGDKIIFVVVT